MAILSDETFRFLSLCAQPPGSAAVAPRLPAALAALPSFDELVVAAEQHGMEPLVLAHLEHAGLAAPADFRGRLQARRMQHAHAAAVRMRVLADVHDAMARARVSFLVLKGAALAHLVYRDPRLRPMRDVDLLIRKADIERALEALCACGFRPGGTSVPPNHHHVQAMARTMEGATVTIELHHQLMVPTPFVAPLGYDDLIGQSQPFDWHGMPCQTLGREDMVWHVYAHAFVINTLRPGAIRLLSVADIVHATEVWIDRIDWARFQREHRRLPQALCVLDALVPWSPHVAEVLGVHARRPATGIHAYPIDSNPEWSAALIPDVVWPPEWWFRMRYGITTWRCWLWFRVVGHPARLALSVGRAVITRLPRSGPRKAEAVGPGLS
jgi:hypothetical protein